MLHRFEVSQYYHLKLLNAQNKTLFLTRLFDNFELSLPISSPPPESMASKELHDFLYTWSSQKTDIRVIDMNLEKEVKECKRLIKVFDAECKVKKNACIEDMASVDNFFGFNGNTEESQSQIKIAAISETSSMNTAANTQSGEERSDKLFNKNLLDEKSINLSKSRSTELTASKSMDGDHIINRLEISLDSTYETLSNIVVLLTLSELTFDKSSYKKYMGWGVDLSADLIQYTIAVIFAIMKKECLIDWDTFRNIKKLKESINSKFEKIIQKLWTLDQIFTALDVFLFPEFMQICDISDPIRSISQSSLDSTLFMYTISTQVIIQSISTLEIYAQYAHHSRLTTCAHFFNNDAYCLSSSADHTASLINTKTCGVEKSFGGHVDAVIHTHYSMCERYIVTVGIDARVVLHDVKTLSVIHTLQSKCLAIKALFTLDGKYLVVTYMNGRVLIFEVSALIRQSSEYFRCYDEHSGGVIGIATYSKYVATVSLDKKVCVFEYLSGKEIYNGNCTGMGWGVDVKFSICGEYLIVGISDGYVAFHDYKHGKVVRVLRVLSMGITCICVGKSAKEVLIGTMEGHVQRIMI